MFILNEATDLSNFRDKINVRLKRVLCALIIYNFQSICIYANKTNSVRFILFSKWRAIILYCNFLQFRKFACQINKINSNFGMIAFEKIEHCKVMLKTILITSIRCKHNIQQSF